VPFESLAVQLGEYAPLDPGALVERFVVGHRGGYCFEVNGVFALLLEALGFAVERHEAVVGSPDAYARGEPTNHLALVVRLPEGPFIAEVGFGQGPLEPLPLADGVTTLGPFSFEVARDGDGWWVGMLGQSPPGFRFTDEVVGLEAFAPHHERLATSPDSGFVRALVVIRAYPDDHVTLRARTLTVGGEARLIADPAELTSVLRDTFGIDTAVLGEDRLARLWDRAVAQHEVHIRQ
jgi:N-hydroxyarylamine O-acetyltransferase